MSVEAQLIIEHNDIMASLVKMVAVLVVVCTLAVVGVVWIAKDQIIKEIRKESK